MKIIRKILGKVNGIKLSPGTKPGKPAKPKIKRSIFDFFHIDCKTIPDYSFIQGETGSNVVGETIQNFRKTLDYKECGIFDTIEVKIIGEKGKNVFFKSFEPDNIRMEDLKQLIDELYLIYGEDNDFKGKFTDSDNKYYQNTKFYMLFGRSWTDHRKHKYPVTINRDEHQVSISIWGVEGI